jgi:hypothetical protein
MAFCEIMTFYPENGKESIGTLCVKNTGFFFKVLEQAMHKVSLSLIYRGWQSYQNEPD